MGKGEKAEPISGEKDRDLESKEFTRECHGIGGKGSQVTIEFQREQKRKILKISCEPETACYRRMKQTQCGGTKAGKGVRRRVNAHKRQCVIHTIRSGVPAG